ncbi:putative ATP binding protein [Helicosporidium sp. ATCC 50920]|nr:putative ATP binding protein [Helicosporidium sp. ATCC 50920]|eukprot:KDD74281.1 putative ATP binding protein [Helicosporidium sp. ATCC 50920]
MDPAAEHFKYPVSIDIRELITLEDVMQELDLGPNGGLLYCMEYMEEHLDEWLGQELESFGEDDYLLFDCPGQIELYSHVNVFRSFVDFLRKDGWQVCAVYCMDAQFVAEAPKFIGGCLSALSAMVHLELPHINVLTKADLIQNKEVLDDYLFPSVEDMQHRLDTTTAPHLRPLNAAMAQLVDQFGLVSFVSLDITDEESIEQLLLQVDSTIQYGEDQEVRTKEYGDFPDEESAAAAGEQELDF